MGRGQGSHEERGGCPRFQFIEFPSEWGVLKQPNPGCPILPVSNLLSSPASGEKALGLWKDFLRQGFQFIEFPSEWGGFTPGTTLRCKPGRFQFIEFPSEWGGK